MTYDVTEGREAQLGKCPFKGGPKERACFLQLQRREFGPHGNFQKSDFRETQRDAVIAVQRMHGDCDGLRYSK